LSFKKQKTREKEILVKRKVELGERLRNTEKLKKEQGSSWGGKNETKGAPSQTLGYLPLLKKLLEITGGGSVLKKETRDLRITRLSLERSEKKKLSERHYSGPNNSERSSRNAFAVYESGRGEKTAGHSGGDLRMRKM